MQASQRVAKSRAMFVSATSKLRTVVIAPAARRLLGQQGDHGFEPQQVVEAPVRDAEDKALQARIGNPILDRLCTLGQPQTDLTARPVNPECLPDASGEIDQQFIVAVMEFAEAIAQGRDEVGQFILGKLGAGGDRGDVHTRRGEPRRRVCQDAWQWSGVPGCVGPRG